MKKVILFLGVTSIWTLGLVTASGRPVRMEFDTLSGKKSSGNKVFDHGQFTQLPGMIHGNLYCYLERKGREYSSQFPKIRIFEFTGKGYVDLGSLRELRRPYAAEQNWTEHKPGFREMGNLPNSADKFNAHKKWNVKTEGRRMQSQLELEEERRKKRFRKFEDFVDSNEAVYCDDVVPFTDRDGETHEVGAIILATQKLEHCEKLKKHLQKNKK